MSELSVDQDHPHTPRWPEYWGRVLDALPSEAELQVRLLSGEANRAVQLEMRRLLRGVAREVERAALKEAADIRATTTHTRTLDERRAWQSGWQNKRETLSAFIWSETIDLLPNEIYGGPFEEWIAAQMKMTFESQRPPINSLHPGVALLLMLSFLGPHHTDQVLNVRLRGWGSQSGARLMGLDLSDWIHTGSAQPVTLDQRQLESLDIDPTLCEQSRTTTSEDPTQIAADEEGDQLFAIELGAAQPWPQRPRDPTEQAARDLGFCQRPLRSGSAQGTVIGWQLSPLDELHLSPEVNVHGIINDTRLEPLRQLQSQQLLEQSRIYIFSSSLDAYELRGNLLAALWSQVRLTFGFEEDEIWSARAHILGQVGADDETWQAIKNRLTGTSDTGAPRTTP